MKKTTSQVAVVFISMLFCQVFCKCQNIEKEKLCNHVMTGFTVYTVG